MPLYWLCYRLNNQISIVIEPSASLIHARMRAAITELDEGTFTEGHELDRKWRMPKSLSENIRGITKFSEHEAD